MKNPFKRWFKKKKGVSPVKPNKGIQTRKSITTTTWIQDPATSLIDYRAYAEEGYSTNSVVYSCIRKIATTAPSAVIRVYKDIEGQPEIIPDHPIPKLLNSPNEYTPSFSFQEQIHTYLNLAGECFMLRDRSDLDGEKLYFLRPDRVTPIPKNRKLLGFIYESELGKRIPFMPDEIVHIKLPNPYDENEGLGHGHPPLSASALYADSDNQGAQFIKNFFKNAAVPYGLLSTKNTLEDPEIERIRARIKQQYAGSSNFHEIMILDADAEYQRLGLSIDEIAFPDLKNISETRICATFSVPPVLIGLESGLEHATFSNVEQSRIFLWTDKLIPDNKRITETLTLFFGDSLAEGEYIAHDYSDVRILQEERTDKFKRASIGVGSGFMTIDEARKEVGLLPFENEIGAKLLEPKSQTNEGKNNEEADNKK